MLLAKAVRTRRGTSHNVPLVAGLALLLGTAAGCPLTPPLAGGSGGPAVFNNTSDPTNSGANFVGSATCAACHPRVAEHARAHGHAQALKPIAGGAPNYPLEGLRAGVPEPPAGKTWYDVSFVIGGYTLNALFVDRDGFLLTNGVERVPTQWILDFPPTGTTAGLVDYKPERHTPLPYEFECFRCHTTGPQPRSAAMPRSQDGRPGIRGTWVEAGVQCEACHGPGSRHVPNPAARDIFVDSSVQTCAGCHTEGGDPEVIVAADGFINANSQYAELRASGGHADFTCTICHDPHASVVYDRGTGVRNACAVCHPDQTMARHGGKTFVRGEYVEELRCESCHMSFATMSVTAAPPEIVGATGRMGDVRSHIFRIDARNVDFSAMFRSDAARVATDGQGRAAVTLDFVCLRCHTDETATDNTAFRLSLEFASEIAQRVHEEAP